MNKNGSLHVYKYGSESIEKRIDDLLQRMIVEEKMMIVHWKTNDQETFASPYDSKNPLYNLVLG